MYFMHDNMRYYNWIVTPSCEIIMAMIETKRCRIREFTHKDVDDIHDIATTPGFVFYSLDGSEEKSREFIERAIALAHEKPRRTHFKMAVECQTQPGRCIGYVAFDALDGIQPDIGYLVHPKWQGKGIATEAMRGLMVYLLAQRPDILDIGLTVHPDNIASRRVAEKLSFREVGHKSFETLRGVEPRIIYETHRRRVLSCN